MVTIQLSRIQHGHFLLLCGVLSVFALVPLLFYNSHNHDFEDSTLENALLHNDVFKVFVFSSIAAAIPLILDLIIDVCTKERFMKQLVPRAFICATLLFTSFLHIYFPLFKKHAYAAWVVYDMQLVMCGSITIHQVQLRNTHIVTSPVFAHIALLCWNGGTLLKAYGGDSTTSTLVGQQVRNVAIFFLFFCTCKHAYMIIKGQLVDWYSTWQQTAFEILIVVAWSVTLAASLIWRDFDDFDVSGTSFLVLSINVVAYLVLMSTIITHEFRHDYSQAQQKLGVKRMFVRYVSHEVRTPLNSCILGIEYMKAAILNPTESCIEEMAGILDEVSEGCNTAIDFMNNLLLYEKIDTMELPLYLKREDLSAVCRQVLKTFQMSARQLDINLSLDIHSSLKTSEPGAVQEAEAEASCLRPRVEIDGPKVVIVLRNLMSNAMKFTPKGGNVTLSILPVNIVPSSGSGKSGDHCTEFHKVDLPPSLPEHTTHFRVILSDTGRGMSEEEQKQLFTKIVQFSPNENQNGGGSGIGLFLSHKIMADHHLQIQVYSEGANGSGTQFFIDFPRERSEDEAMSSNTTTPQSFMSSLWPWKLKRTTRLIATVDEEEKPPESDIPGCALEVETRADPHTLRNSPPTHSVQSSARGLITKGDSEDYKSLHELSILIVDDSVLNRKMMTRTLKQHRIGATYSGAGDGVELLSLFGVPDASDTSVDVDMPVDIDIESNMKLERMCTLQNQKAFDVILLDDHMTQMDGSTAVKALRQFGYTGLVIGVTGSALDDDLKAFCAAGVDYALPKPFVIEDFINILNKHCRHH
jgi:signal transduction histidine kinase/CheY-like chemotaxis protein